MPIFQKKHFKERITQYFLAENKSPCFLVKLSKQNLLQLNMSKIWKLWLPSFGETSKVIWRYGLQYTLGDMSHFSYTKKR